MHETCRQYVDRRLSEGWKIVWQQGYHLTLSSPSGSVLRPVDLRNDVETLRPNAAGDETNLDYEEPESEAHHTLVDEVTADGLATYVGSYPDDVWQRDFYNIADHSVGSGTINYIAVVARCQKMSSEVSKLKIAIKAGTGTGDPDTVSEGEEIDLVLDTWIDHSKYWSTNPATGSAWTWDEIDKLQIGVSLYYESIAYGCCTQVYVEVDYTSVTAPTVTTQAVSDIGTTTATGNGNITDNGGENCSKRGICWNTTGNPTVAGGTPGYGESEETDSFGTGAFERPMTGLTPGQHYYVRAYAYNSAGYGYGDQVEFTTATTAYKDIAARFRLWVQKFKDIATRFKLIAQVYKDTTTRFRLTVQAYRDTASRFRLIVQNYRDAATRFRLWAEAYRNIATRFILNALNYQDIAARFKLTVRAYQDIATRFKLIAQAYRDIVTRFGLSMQTYQDVSTRFFLCQPTWEEIQIQQAVEALKAEIAGLELEPRAHFRI